MNPTNLKTGDILHCSGRKLTSKLIKRFTRSEFSHTALFIEIWGQPYIIDAQKDGVNLRPWSAWQEEYDYNFIAMRSPNSIDCKEIAQRALTKVGHTGYDFEGLILRHPWQLLTGKWNEKRDMYERMTCSEFVMWVYGSEKAYKITPDNIFRWCMINDWKTILINK